MTDARVTPASIDPLDALRGWYTEAADRREAEPDAMALATTDSEGRPSVRMVLCKGIDERGVVFFTNYGSAKGHHLDRLPWAALAWRWPVLDRQVRLSGPVERLSAAESDAYFATRSREAQLGAWASEQSAVLSDRDQLLGRLASAEERFAGCGVPRPPQWGGFLVRPAEIELWQGRPARLHERWRYRYVSGGWVAELLSP